MSDAPLRVLMVCTGNICRSPMMERILRAAIDRCGASADVAVASAGTWANTGEPMQPFATMVLAERGIDPAGFAATLLTEDLVRTSDLVVTATRAHRAHVVALVPGAVRRTFTLLELAQISANAPAAPHVMSSDPTECLRQTVAFAAQMRGMNPRLAHGLDDVDDPLGAPIEVYRERADAIATAAGQIVPFLIGGRAPWPAG